MDDLTACPLTWPAWVPRTEPAKVTSSQFKVSPGQALNDLYDELRRAGASDIVVSTNAAVRRDGRPYARPPRIDDEGVAVWFTRKGKAQVIPCDKFHTIHENVRAIGLTLAAIRAMERYGTTHMVDAVFTGFAALPASTGGSSEPRSWWDVLGLDRRTAGRANVERAYRDLRRVRHPDGGGTDEQFIELQAAYRQAMEAVA